MFRPDRFIALDIGASKVVVAEFSRRRREDLQLLNYGVGRIEVDPESDVDPSPFIVAVIRDLMNERQIKPAPLLMTVSGQAVFPRFVKLPAVSSDKVEQMINYEAEQNVPFPINEVVWDYQLIGESDGEMNAMLVAVKGENVASLTDCVQAVGLEPEIVDVAPMALYNVVRYNYPGLQGCTMVLDIGARSSNVIFVEDNRIFSRSIPVAGNAITQEIAKEFDVPFAQAEEMKKTHAFVAFGGVSAGVDNDEADRISKIVRNVVTRLHAEVNRSVNFYRSQQGGTAPSLVLLAGGSSIIPHMDTFFREKLKVQVEYLNPFVNIPVSASIDAEQIGGEVHLLGEVAGLALRRFLVCPVEINLMPPHLVARKRFRRRQPFFALAAAAGVVIMLCWWVYFHEMQKMLGERVDSVDTRINRLRVESDQMTEMEAKRDASLDDARAIAEAITRRTAWLRMLEKVQDARLDGMWLRGLKPVIENGAVTHLDISGQGFVDKFVGTAGATASERYVQSLLKTGFFSEDTQITSEPVVREEFVREFVIRAALKEPLRIR